MQVCGELSPGHSAGTFSGGCDAPLCMSQGLCRVDLGRLCFSLGDMLLCCSCMLILLGRVESSRDQPPLTSGAATQSVNGKQHADKKRSVGQASITLCNNDNSHITLHESRGLICRSL